MPCRDRSGAAPCRINWPNEGTAPGRCGCTPRPAAAAVRRFQKKHRNQLWTSDIKYGPYLPIGKDGAKKQVYLVTFSDDATRAVMHGEFYPTLDQIIVEDCFRQAIQKFGAPDRGILR